MLPNRTSRARCAAGPLLMLVAFCALAAPAGAVVQFDSAVHRTFGVIPAIGQRGGVAGSSRAAAARAGFSCVSACTPLQYNGGPVQHGEKVYLLFWAPANYSPAFPASYETGMGTWVADLAAANGTAGNPISINTQYYDLSGPGGTKSYVPYSIQNGGALTDTNAYPPNGCNRGITCLTDAQIRSQLSTYIVANSLPTGIDVEYFVLTPQGVNSCFDTSGTSCSYSNFCGYHSTMSVSSNTITYADMPWAYNVSGCDVNNAFATGYPNSNFIDPVVSVFSHELSETMTDPLVGNGWVDSSGNEIGDKCAYTYGAAGYGSTTGMNNNGGGYWNVQLGGDVYLLQQEYDNQINNCVTRMTESWKGAIPTGPNASKWSGPANWVANNAPGAGSSTNDSVDTLSFPKLSSGACAAQPPTDTCYTATNDLTSLSAYGLSVDDGSGYTIGGNGLTLGAGGLSATTAAAVSDPSSESAPITLGANQTWSIDGGAHNVGQLRLGGAIGGSSDTLAVNLANAGSLTLGSAEVGNATIAGASGSATGANARLNGSVTVGSALNGTDNNSVTLTDAALLAPGSPVVGGLTSTGGDVEVGQPALPAGILTVMGGLTLDSASRTELFVDHPGTTAVTDYSQVVVHGNVTLGGNLVLGSPASCPSLTLGDQYTLITATGSLSGTFFGVPNGADVQLACTGSQPKVQINYTANSVTGTVVTLSPPWNNSTPTISGTAQEGSALTLTHGQWTNIPTLISDQWAQCSGASCSPIPDATSSSYRPTAADVGHTLQVVETATNAAGTGDPIASTQTSVVSTAGGDAGAGGGGAGGGAGAGGGGGGDHAGSGTLAVGPLNVATSHIDVPLSCTGAIGARCAVTLTLTVTETLAGGKVTVVTAIAHKQHHKGPTTRTLVVGTATLSLNAGQSQRLQIALNATGERLLTVLHVLRTHLAVTQGGHTVATSSVTFRSGVAHKHHRKH